MSKSEATIANINPGKSVQRLVEFPGGANTVVLDFVVSQLFQVDRASNLKRASSLKFKIEIESDGKVESYDREFRGKIEGEYLKKLTFPVKTGKCLIGVVRGDKHESSAMLSWKSILTQK